VVVPPNAAALVPVPKVSMVRAVGVVESRWGAHPRPGEHQQAARVVHLHVAADSEMASDGADAPLVHQDVGLVIVDCRDDASVPDQRSHPVETPISASTVRVSMIPTFA
jgi:hypothetical protein